MKNLHHEPSIARRLHRIFQHNNRRQCWIVNCLEATCSRVWEHNSGSSRCHPSTGTLAGMMVARLSEMTSNAHKILSTHTLLRFKLGDLVMSELKKRHVQH
jgi:hypothetical protein